MWCITAEFHYPIRDIFRWLKKSSNVTLYFLDLNIHKLENYDSVSRTPRNPRSGHQNPH